MKRMTCEICGSNELEKRDGVFICNSCGTRYSTEEAKKLLIEVKGHVDVSGSTVKVDKNEQLQNLYTVARRYRNSKDFEAAAKQYETILIDDPDSWEATFYSVYCRAASCTIAEIMATARLVSNSLPAIIQMVKKNIPTEQQKTIVREIATQVASLYRTLTDSSYDFYKPYDNYASITNDWTECAVNAGVCGDIIEKNYKNDENTLKIAAFPWDVCVYICGDLLGLRPLSILDYRTRNSIEKMYYDYKEKIDRVRNPVQYREKMERKKEEERKRIEENEVARKAKLPKTEEEKQKLKEQEIKEKKNKIIILFVNGILSILFSVGFITFCLVRFGEIPGSMMIFILILLILGIFCLKAARELQKE